VSADPLGCRYPPCLYHLCPSSENQSIHESSLREIAQISAANPDLEEDTQQLFDSVARNLEDVDLRNAVELARTHLALLREKPPARVTQRS
jgi:hypothetical protein